MSEYETVTEQPGVELTEIDVNDLPQATGPCALVFPLKESSYATLTQVELADDKFMTWRKYKACTVCLPFLTRKVGDVEPTVGGFVSTLDQIDDATSLVSCCGTALDYAVQQCIWGGPKPPMSYLLEVFSDKGGELKATYQLKDKRSSQERICRMKLGHWSLYPLGSDELLMKANYKRNCVGIRTHYVLKDKDGKILASHQLQKPTCTCDCSCAAIKRCCCYPCYCIADCCSSYKPLATYMTPDEPTEEIPKYLPDYRVKEGVRLMNLTCCGLCCGKSHGKVEFPHFFGAGKELPPPTEEPEAEDEKAKTKKKVKRGDNRVIVKDVGPLQKTCNLFEVVFDEMDPGMLGELGDMGALVDVISEIKDAKDELSDLKDEVDDAMPEGDVDEKAGAGGLKWSRSKNDTYGIEYPSHFTSAQRSGMLLMALEYDRINQ
jgi:hypothetical protein